VVRIAQAGPKEIAVTVAENRLAALQAAKDLIPIRIKNMNNMAMISRRQNHGQKCRRRGTY
jgi:heterodisulfide reductase subunit A-like polyferredoxin